MSHNHLQHEGLKVETFVTMTEALSKELETETIFDVCDR